MTRRLSTDPQGPAVRVCAGEPVQEPGRRPCLAGPGRGRAGGGGSTPPRGQGGATGLTAAAGPPPTPEGRWRHRLSVQVIGTPGPGWLSLSQSCAGAAGLQGRTAPGAAGGALIGSAVAGSTPTGGGPSGMRPSGHGLLGGGEAAGRQAALGELVRLPGPPAAVRARLTGPPAVAVRAGIRRAWRA